MEQIYKHLVRGLTVPQALRLAMLCLARRPATDQKPSRVVESVADSEQDGEEVDFKGHVAETWQRPMHWAGFLVIGASTRLPLHS